MSLEDLQEVVNDYERLLEIDEGYDVIIYAGENEDAKELHAHSNILRIRSQYFRTAFSNEWAKKKDGKFIFEKHNISSHLFKIILRFIYCGKIDLMKLQSSELLKLSMAVDELNIQSLTSRIEYLLKCDSVIIEPKHFEKLFSWMGKFDFNLLYRSSRDGDTIAKFHEKTDNKGANIVVIKIKNSNQIVGGYNPLDWCGYGLREAYDSFIFSFEDYKNVNTGKCGRIIDIECAIWSSSNMGPVFGSGCDLMLDMNGNWSSVTNSYPDLNIPKKFEIEDYEVFQIIQNN